MKLAEELETFTRIIGGGASALAIETGIMEDVQRVKDAGQHTPSTGPAIHLLTVFTGFGQRPLEPRRALPEGVRFRVHVSRKLE